MNPDPDPPVGVRLVLDDGTTVPVPVAYAGRDIRGVHQWTVLTEIPAARIRGVRCDLIPGRTALRIPLALPPGSDTS
jgi:hypothetical protein